MSVNAFVSLRRNTSMDSGGDAVQCYTGFFFMQREKEPDVRAGGDCYTFKSPGSPFFGGRFVDKLFSFLIFFFFLPLDFPRAGLMS